MTPHDLSIHFFLNLIVILIAVRIVGFLARMIGQPQVVGEMIAGVLIGPTFLGFCFPSLQQSIFTSETVRIIYVLSQIGLVLYMFTVGLELELGIIRERFKGALSISLAGILAPFTVGGLFGYLHSGDPRMFSGYVAGWEAWLFVGAAMSITAFPMLARIIFENKLSGTTLGTLALAAGATDDVAAWCLLAVVVGSVSGDLTIAVTAIGGGVAFVLMSVFILSKILNRVNNYCAKNDSLTHGSIGFVLIILMFSAWFTDTVGIYSVFGAFVLGMCTPRGTMSKQLIAKIEPLTSTLFLPLFFIYSGLKTQIALAITGDMFLITITILVIACLGKGAACGLAAKFSGESNRNSIAIGALMNARGLMELILLNIGLEKGIITPTLFSMMVIMAIVTTLLTSPIFFLLINPAAIKEGIFGTKNLAEQVI